MFEERVTDVISAKMSKPERIKNAIDRMVGKFTKSQILETCPDISETTVERTLKQFLDNGFIRRIGAGRGAAYCKA